MKVQIKEDGTVEPLPPGDKTPVTKKQEPTPNLGIGISPEQIDEAVRLIAGDPDGTVDSPTPADITIVLPEREESPVIGFAEDFRMRVPTDAGWMTVLFTLNFHADGTVTWVERKGSGRLGEALRAGLAPQHIWTGTN